MKDAKDKDSQNTDDAKYLQCESNSNLVSGSCLTKLLGAQAF